MRNNILNHKAMTWSLAYLLVALSISYTIANYWQKKVEKVTVDDLAGIVEYQQDAIQQFLYHYADHLLFFSKMPDVKQAISSLKKKGSQLNKPEPFKEVEEEFLLYLSVENKVMQLRLIDAVSGMELMRVERNENITSAIPESALQDKSHRDYFKHLIELKTNDIYISDISLNQENGKISTPVTPTIRLGRPVETNTQTIAAFVFMNINIHKLFEEVSHKRFFGSDTYSVFLNNNNGDFLIHPNSEKTFGFEYGNQYRWEHSFKDLQRDNRFEYIGNGLTNPSSEYYILSRKIWLDNNRFVTLSVATSTQSVIWAKWTAFAYCMLSFFVFSLFVAFLLYRIRVKTDELNQQELLKAEERFHLIVEAAPHGKIVVNDKGIIEMVNAEIEEIFGYERQELIGQPILTLIPDSVKSRHGHYHKTFMQTPSKRTMGKGQELFGRRKDGSEVPLEIGLSPIKFGQEQKVLCGVIDISERKKYESLFKTAIDSAPNAILMINDEGLIELTNRELENLFGYMQGDMIGKPVEMLLPERFRSAHVGHRQNYFKGPKKRAMGAGQDLFGLTSSGNEIPIEIALQPVQTNAGLKIFSSIFDLTDVLRRERKLRHLTDILNRTNKIAKIGGWELDLETLEVTWSEQTFALYDMPFSDKPMSFEESIRCYDEQSRELLAEHIQKATEEKQGWNLELLMHTSKGNTRWVNTIGTVELKDEKPVKLIGTIQDITERKQVMEELERSNKDLDSFAYIASHDLKSPLRGVQQLTNWIEEDLKAVQDSEINQHLSLLRSRVNRMERLLDDLLTYSRVGREDAKIETVDVTELITYIFDFCNVSGNFNLVIEGYSGHIKVLRVPLEKVLRNLINNAIKHHDKPTGTITVNVELQTKQCIFEIKDDGPGIDAEFNEVIFEIFKTLRPRDEIEGSGMGLAIVKKSIESQGGKIEVFDNVPRGACFRFSWQFYID